MSREIDERVVQMKFENGQFEHNVQTSIHSLDELKKGLNFKDASKGLESIDKASKEIKMDPLTRAVETLNNRFNLLGITAFNVMNRISNKAIDTGETLIRSLSTDQIEAGWGKFAEKTGSVQTIMAATAKQFTDTGEQMEFVNKQLNKLNWFTDETSYNFLDMVSNIGKFTSNNIDLGVSVTAMQGVANWAAISGANANEASRAMYNLSQAISTGSLKLMDWMSIENANMATAQFKETAIEAAVNVGTLKRGADGLARTLKGNTVSVENFRENLSEAWLTSKVLLDTLDLYGGATDKLNEVYEETGILTSDIVAGIDDYVEGAKTAEQVAEDWDISLEQTKEILEAFNNETMQFGLKAFKAAQEAKTFEDAINSVKDAVSTGWMKSFEYIFGDYLEAKEFWTWLANALYQIFAESGEYRNEMLSEWKDKGGRDTFIDTLYASMAALLSIMTPIRQAWYETFGRFDADKLLKVTNAVHSFVLSLVQTEERADKLKRTFKGLFSVLDISKTLVGGALLTAWEVFKTVTGAVNLDIWEFTARIGDALTAFHDWVKTETWLTDASRSFIGILKQSVTSVKNFGNSIRSLKGVDAIIKAFNKSFTSNFKGVGSIVTAVGKTFAWLIEKIRTMKMPKTFEEVKQFFSELRSVAMFNLEDIGISFDGLRELADGASQAIRDVLGYLSDKFSEASIICANALRFLADEAGKIDWSGVILVGAGIGILVIMWKMTTALADLAKALSRVTGVFGEAKGAFTAIKEYFNALKKSLNAKIVLTYAISIGILAASFAGLAMLKWGQIAKGAIAIGLLSAALIGIVAAVNKFGTNVPGMAALFLSFSASVAILAYAFNSIDTEGWLGRIALLGTLMASIVAVAAALNKFAPQLAVTAGTLLGIAASVLILAKAFEMIGKMNAENIFKALPIVTAIGLFMTAFTALQAVVNAIPGSKFNTNFLSFISIALSIRILASAIEKIGKMDQDVLMKGLTTANTLITELGLIMLASRAAGKNAGKAGVMILAISVALMLMKGVIKNLAKLSAGEVTKGLTIIALLSAVFSGLMVMSQFAGPDAAKAGIMLLAMAGALSILQLVVKTLGQTDTDVLVKGVLAVSALMLAMTPIIAFSKEADNATKSLVKITAVIVAVGAMIALIASVSNGDSALLAATAISEVLLAVSGMIKILENHKARDLTESVKMAVELTVIVGALGLVIAACTQMPNPEAALPVATAMSVLLIALTVSLKLVAGLDDSRLLEKTTTAAKAMLKVIGVLAIVFGSLGALAVLLGAIDQGTNGGLSGAIKSSVQMMKDLGEAIGGFLGSIVGGAIGGFGDSMFSVLPSIGESLSGFMTNAQPFFDGLNSIPGGMFAVAADLIGMMLMLTGAEFVEGLKQIPIISSIFDAGSENLPDQFRILGECCKAFADALGDADYSNVEAAANAGKMLAELERNLPGSTTNIDGTIPDKQGLEAFGERLKAFGTAISGFARTVSGLDVDVVETAAAAGETLATLEASLQPVGGTVHDWFFGSKDLAEFGNRLFQFGFWIRVFASQVKGLDTDAIETARVAGSTLAELENSLPAQQGLLQIFITGNKNIAQFGKRLKEFGKAIVTFSDEVGGIDIVNVLKASVATRLLSDAEKNLGVQGGAKGFWFGDSSLGTFGKNLKDFGRGLSDFSSSIETVDFTKIHNAIDYITDLISVSNLVNASEIMASAATDLMNEVISVILANESEFRKKGQDIAKWVAEGFKAGVDKYSAIATGAATKLGERIDKAVRASLEIHSPSAVMEEVGRWTVKGLAEGISKDTSAEEAAAKKASNIVSAFQTVLSRLSTQGETASLEYQLWELTDGVTADDATKNARMMQLKEEELKMEAEKVRTHNATLAALRQSLGEDSDQYKEAYNKYLSAQISMIQKANEIDQLQNTAVMDEREQMKAFANTMKEYAETFEMLGKSKEDLEQFAREKTGYGVEQLRNDLINTSAIMESALADQTVKIEESVAANTAKSVSAGLSKGMAQASKKAATEGENTGDGLAQGIAKAVDEKVPGLGAKAYELWSAHYSDAADQHSPSREAAKLGEFTVAGLIQGMDSKIPEARDVAIRTAEAVLNGFRSQLPNFEYLGRMSMQGFINGINQVGQNAIAAAQAIAARVASIMRSTLRINSPSKVTQEIGHSVGEGFAMGILDNAPMVDKSSDELANNALLGLDHIKSQISNILANEDEYAPTITPVLDLDMVKSQASSIPGLLGSNSSLQVRTSFNRANAIAATRNTPVQNGSSSGVGDTNYNFTQNNYSPKALNRVEIYRQTQNQFSQLKGATRR